jgi:hypothetical protein
MKTLLYLCICTLEPQGGGRASRTRQKEKEAKPHGEKIKLDRMQLFSCCLQAVSLSYSSIQVEKIYTPAKLHLHTQAENPSIL